MDSVNCKGELANLVGKFLVLTAGNESDEENSIKHHTIGRRL